MGTECKADPGRLPGPARDERVWGPYALVHAPGLDAFHVGRRCCIRNVHHPVFAAEVGRLVVIARAAYASRIAFVYEDRPVTVRRNRHGNTVRSDPRCIQTLMSYDSLDPYYGSTGR